MPLRQAKPKRGKGGRADVLGYSRQFEERLAARWANYTLSEFYSLVGDHVWIDPDADIQDSQASILAGYRVWLKMKELGYGD